MIMQNTRESALRRDEFHRILQEWLDESLDECAGDELSHSGPAWLWVRHGGNHFYLHASSTRTGIRAYLRLVGEEGGEPAWSVQETPASGDRVGVGRSCEIIEGFDLYHQTASR
jgi:hypothetical protein